MKMRVPFRELVPAVALFASPFAVPARAEAMRGLLGF